MAKCTETNFLFFIYEIIAGEISWVCFKSSREFPGTFKTDPRYFSHVLIFFAVRFLFLFLIQDFKSRDQNLEV